MTQLTNKTKTSCNWDSIVIGSGLGGLVTASQLASKGAKVLVLEQYKIPGGSGGSFKRKGFTFDVGASMIFGFGEKGYTNLLTRALKDVGQECETIPDPTQLAYHLPNQLEITVDRDYKKFITKLIDLFPHEEKGINHFYETCWDVFNCLEFDAFTFNRGSQISNESFFKSPLSCLGLARWLPVNAGDVARRYIKDPALLKFIDIECFCWSVMPADLTPMINAGMVFSDRHYGGINYPKGGVGIIAEKLVKGIENFKGEIRYKSKVKKIIFEKGKAIGVSLDNGEEIFGKTIVSNATRWDTFGGQGINDPLVESDKTPQSEKKWKKRYIPSPSFLSLHLGVNKDSIPSNTHCHHLLLDAWEEMEHEQGVTFLSIPTLLDPSLAPSGSHIVHAFTPSSMDCWEGLSNKEYLDKEKRRWR